MNHIDAAQTNTLPELTPITQPEVKRKSTGFMWVGIFVIFLLGVGFGFSWKPNLGQPPVVLPSATPQPEPSPTSEPKQEGAVTWFATPRTISGISLFKPQSALPEDMGYYLTDSAKYVQLGELPDKTKLVKASVTLDAPGGDMVVRCLIHPNDTLECLKEGLDQWTIESLPQILLPVVDLTSTAVEGLIAPDTLTIKGVLLKKIQAINDTFSLLTKPTLLEQTTYGGVYRTISPITETSSIYARGIYLRLKDDSLVIYQPTETAYGSAKSLEKDGATYTQYIMPGCGSRLIGSLPVYNGSDASVAPITNKESALIKSLYEVYSMGREGTPDYLSIEAFSSKPTHLLWKDSLGEWQVFVNDAFAPMVECGKPVVYLYPPSTIPVTVQVGALINKSEPLYPDGGWSVIADPDGKLSYQGKVYDSLFWEGKGDGVYPDYRNQGIVVRQSELVFSLHQQMTALGLNNVEQADFMEFWQPRLPKTPYVRLTWLGTREMDVLAPLSVSPQPDTSIRVFLEFEGLSSFRKLTPQRLSAPARKGFTLVEWGGLLVGESESKKQ